MNGRVFIILYFNGYLCVFFLNFKFFEGMFWLCLIFLEFVLRFDIW